VSALKELTDYRNTIIQRIVGNQSIVKALYYNDIDFLDKPDLDSKTIKSKLLFSNIFPFNFIPTSDEELKLAKSYITISITDVKPTQRGVKFNSGSIFVSILLHRDSFKTDYGYLRSDFLISEVHDLLNQQEGIGMGKLEFKGMREYSINADYHGNILHYRPVDFN